MARIYTQPGDEKPQLDKKSIQEFFELRAQKAADLGPTRAVIYQDNNPELAKQRDKAEKELLLPKLKLSHDSRILDAGCGTGRWAKAVLPLCASYLGVDMSPGLIAVAKEQIQAANCQFQVCPVDEISPEVIGMDCPFTHILSFGVFIYLNDADILKALEGYASVIASNGKILFREPIAILQRLTLLEHFSEDMQQPYSAIYRTSEELQKLFATVLQPHGFLQFCEGDVYTHAALNNRAETKQKWFLWGKDSK